MSAVESTRVYVGTFILDTRGVEKDVETLIEDLKKVISDAGGEVTAEENLGRRDFAYATDRHHTGDVYIQLRFNGGPDIQTKLQNALRLEKWAKRLMVQRES